MDNDDVNNNLTQQLEEIEALTSIFGEDRWRSLDKTGKNWCIEIDKNVQFYVTLTPDYPSKSLPKYDLLAPEMNTAKKGFIHEEFQKLFQDSCGSALIYQMINLIQEVVDNDKKNDKNNEIVDNNLEVDVREINKQFEHIEIIHGDAIVDRKSVFQAHVAKIKDKNELNFFMEKLKENRKISHATHNISAYRIRMSDNNNVLLQDCDDDGENKASSRLLELLQILKLENIVVVVSRWYGGVPLGPDRFRHISNAARDCLVKAGFVK